MKYLKSLFLGIWPVLEKDVGQKTFTLEPQMTEDQNLF